ncbi:hypothetical protein JTE90_029165 [Oedothorax gibbosus]|uniref:Uncharacterized protein n=1 Tax=Oedothorax gibbosus TaxID=931172 RepID=A0AAV6VFU4_9ARAC|nr:hypothetical protein JTE90_029165 [Oedothorax gibbosus]
MSPFHCFFMQMNLELLARQGEISLKYSHYVPEFGRCYRGNIKGPKHDPTSTSSESDSEEQNKECRLPQKLSALPPSNSYLRYHVSPYVHIFRG